MMLSVVLSTGFVPPQRFLTAPQAQRNLHIRCSMQGTEEASRRAVLSGFASALAGTSAAPAWAGYVYSLGIETTKPTDAEKDDDLLSSNEVQKGLENIKSYRKAVAMLKAQFDADQNLQLIPLIRKQFDFSKLRDDLNVVTTVFDDTTQLTTDRVTRAILYDLTELENASRVKKGDADRTPKKVANVNKWFGKLDNDFGVLLTYF
mmetsp:Transcript_25094/g.41557  ORF Transcript_25094/g.41557 Transcript_25094/m.41557 type:complete len:205 (+) Transcript_25094:30-644(+)|eukprot:CAMPEP_0119311070 /NCGR_PEP_ID=MMETSP1333-20130426/21491_1 /TAXON_ID=418940 /ORGANISM="Scyphosphaera apsteinii, Strain RCC1455" /LENGTH=204 /DNA_ID=CAMNT_0007315365 /DNA_START=29 /DNA_END=643 /DNA_ORIENTATION=-